MEGGCLRVRSESWHRIPGGLYVLLLDDNSRDSKLVDDILDYEAREGALGKPGGADLQLGLATGPALFAWEEHPQMGPLIERKFEREGDVELVDTFTLLTIHPG